MTADDRSVLVLGATGTTGRRVVGELQRAGVSVRAASRHPSPGHRSGGGAVEPVRFDWEDATTHDAALAGARAVYLMAPAADPAPADRMAPFVQRAVHAGVERIVLASASAIERGDPGLGEVHDLVAGIGVEWAVVRPSWFMQNLWNAEHPIGAAVRSGADIVTATGKGKVAFVDAADIARVAAHALTDPQAPDRDLVVTGPDALDYDEVAATLTRSLGRPVHHRSVSPAQLVESMVGAGVPAAFAELLAQLDLAIAAGAEAGVTDTVQRVTGVAPRSLATVLADDDPYHQERP